MDKREQKRLLAEDVLTEKLLLRVNNLRIR